MSNEFIVKFRPFDKVECCFNIVAVFGNNVAVFGKKCRTKFRPLDKVDWTFDNVAWTLLLWWSGLNA